MDGGGEGLPGTNPGLCCIGAASLVVLEEIHAAFATRNGWNAVVGRAERIFVLVLFVRGIKET